MQSFIFQKAIMFKNVKESLKWLNILNYPGPLVVQNVNATSGQ